MNAPTLRPDGSLLNTPGYDGTTGLLYCPRTTFPPLRAAPTLDDARTAIGVLQELTTDFCFPNSTHQSAAWAALLTAAGRSAIVGNVPLLVVRSNTPGSGKGLLVSAVALAATGKQPALWADTKDDEEFRKRLFTVAMAGDPLVCIDNVEGIFGSPALDMAVTTGMIAERAMGTFTRLEAPWTAVVFVTGNNMIFKGDTARRALVIDLDPKVEHPEARTGFQHYPLLPWAAQQHPRLVTAALTLLLAYFTAGCPDQQLTPWGSFEAWSDLIRGCLVWAGEPDPAATRASIDVDTNTDFAAWSALLDAWHTCYVDTSVMLRQAQVAIAGNKTTVAGAPLNKWDDLGAALEALDPQARSGQGFDTKRVGYAFRKWQGRVIGNKRLIKDPKSTTKGTLYRVELI